MIVQGDKDTAVPVESKGKWLETMKEMGIKYEYIELPGGNHGTVINEGMPNIFRFFVEHPKASVQ